MYIRITYRYRWTNSLPISQNDKETYSASTTTSYTRALVDSRKWPNSLGVPTHKHNTLLEFVYQV